MNQYDSGKMAGQLLQAGWQLAEKAENADVVLVNTCSVREKAEIRAIGRLHILNNLKKKKPNLKIVVAGCTTQYNPDLILKKAPFVDLVLGIFNQTEIVRLLDEIAGEKNLAPRVEILPKSRQKLAPLNFYAEIPEQKTKNEAYSAITYGCNNFCSYCVVPFARGREISRPVPEIIGEIKKFDFQKFPRLVLLGQNVNSYRWENFDFPDLLAEVHKISGPKVIKFLTSHPKDASDKLIQTIKNLPKISRTIHLPLQAGDNQILKLMNREYTIDDFKNLVKKIRAEIKDAEISTDIIVGFPGETEEQFQNTLKALREIGFCRINVAAFSSRPKTAAADLPHQLPAEIKAKRLQAVLNYIKNPHNHL